ncbi:unnamed protein product [Rotaria socialis]
MKTGKKLLDEMPENYRNDNITSTSAIDMLMKFGDVESAERIFRSIKAKDIITYGAMVKGYVGNEMFEKALDLFEQIHLRLTNVIYTIVFNTCAKLCNDRAMKLGKELLAKMPENYRNNNITSTSAIDMLMKFGDVESAERMFRSIKAKGTNIYGALMNGCNLNGESWKCFKIFEEMKEKDVIPDEIAWNILLGACSKSGMLHHCQYIVNQIPLNIQNKIRIQNSLIDMWVDCLSRLFMFDEAQQLIEDYEKTNTPSIVMYMSLLSGARNNRNSNLSEKIYKRMKTLFPNAKESLAAGVVLLSNIYSSLGKYEEAKNFRSNQIEELRVKVKVGLSWTEIKGHIVQLKAHDHSHPQSTESYAKIDRLKSKAIENGFIFGSSWITRSLNENETIKSVLCGHSELLVIALNLIQEPAPKFIQVVKNLRVCGHCHEFTKVIAKIEQCDIVVRDANRIHHFYPNG